MSKNKFYNKQHTFYLNKIYNNVDLIGEDIFHIDWIIREGIWYQSGTLNQHTLCDLIINYDDETVVPVELKGSYNQESKAIKQLESGCRFAYEQLHKLPRHCVFAVYNKNKIEYEILEVN